MPEASGTLCKDHPRMVALIFDIKLVFELIQIFFDSFALLYFVISTTSKKLEFNGSQLLLWLSGIPLYSSM